ncbi:hypothetical protein FRD01_14600 [Microvenator marinus]|uniref:Uncharacterized protein n=1 Tax=Microvenator marinus TaxID=2600177 RepID=A0A5B8XR83_9DELT|nr:hypothetical protein [Microvenator marinus]QED28442.1 hypothetical protein FRD01_14600 [Microvenator marinus]
MNNSKSWMANPRMNERQWTTFWFFDIFKLYNLTLLMVSLFLVSPLPVQAEGGDTTVIASGYGATAAEAKRAAQRNAIEDAVGVLVSHETIVENDQLIADKILTYSGGFIRSWEVLREEKLDEVFFVEIRAIVSSARLLNRLEELEVVNGEIRGQDISAEAASKQRRAEDSRKVLNDALEPFFNSSCVSSEIVSQSEVELGSSYEKRLRFRVRVGVNVKCYKEAHAILISALDSVAVRASEPMLGGKTAKGIHFLDTIHKIPNAKRPGTFLFAVQRPASYASGPAIFDLYYVDSASVDRDLIRDKLRNLAIYLNIEWFNESTETVLSRRFCVGGGQDCSDGNRGKAIDGVSGRIGSEVHGSSGLLITSWSRKHGGSNTLHEELEYEVVIENAEQMASVTGYKINIESYNGMSTSSPTLSLLGATCSRGCTTLRGLPDPAIILALAFFFRLRRRC